MSDLDKLEMDPAVNWTQLLDNTERAVNSMLGQLDVVERTFSNWDLLPFNMTAIKAKWAQFYQDMEQLQYMDYYRY